MLLAGCLSAQGRKERVLFIGNSYTYVNDLPGIVANMARSTGDTLEYDISAPGGHTYAQHVGPANSNTETITKLRAGGWDYVVLQEQSLFCAKLPENYYPSSFVYARYLIDTVRRYSPRAAVILYMTWGKKNGMPPNECVYFFPPYTCAYSSMDSLIRTRYMELARFTSSMVSPVSAVWRYIRSHHPAIELYDTDESHPSPAGSYAGACSFYTAIFGRSPERVSYNFSLPTPEAATIRQAARRVVYDSLPTWNIKKRDK